MGESAERQRTHDGVAEPRGGGRGEVLLEDELSEQLVSGEAAQKSECLLRQPQRRLPCRRRRRRRWPPRPRAGS